MRTLGISLAVLMLFAVGFAADTARAQNLPSCTGTNTDVWNNCVGTHVYANGAQYVGEFGDGLRNGQGIYVYANGVKYVGQYKDDQEHGQGTLYAANGTVLGEGQWENRELVRSFKVPR